MNRASECVVLEKSAIIEKICCYYRCSYLVSYLAFVSLFSAIYVVILIPWFKGIISDLVSRIDSLSRLFMYLFFHQINNRTKYWFSISTWYQSHYLIIKSEMAKTAMTKDAWEDYFVVSFVFGHRASILVIHNITKNYSI